MAAYPPPENPHASLNVANSIKGGKKEMSGKLSELV